MTRHENRIPPDEFMPYAPDTLGQQANVHHCKLGKNNDRMYVRRNEDGSVIAYCHHCGGRGYSRGTATARSKPQSRSEATTTRDGRVRLPGDFTTDVGGSGDGPPWSPQAKAWVRKYGVTDDELAANNVGYSRSLGGVVFPVFMEEGEAAFYQYRPVDRQAEAVSRKEDTEGESTDAPKYISVGKRNVYRDGGIFRTVPNWPSGACNPDGTPIRKARGVIVEDVLSAIIVSRIPGYQGIALMGLGISEKAMKVLAMEYDDIIVFLDNDNKEVRASQRKLNKVLAPLIRGECRIICSDKDPKEHRRRELLALLEVKEDEETKGVEKEES